MTLPRSSNDPLGYPIYDEPDLAVYLADTITLPVVCGDGFIASGMATAGAMVFTAHSWYWLKPDQFAKVFAETYANGVETGSCDLSALEGAASGGD